MTAPTAELADRLRAAGQEHVLAFWDDLDDAGRARLADELAALDLEEVARLAAELRSDASPEAPSFSPPELFPLRRDAGHARRAEAARARGAELLAAGRVGFVLVAGGQGSRLGYDGPKGEYPVGPVTGASLFAWHAARLAAASARHDFTPTWYVMTSATNDARTREAFAEADHFGLGADNVYFFTQAMLPALTPEGKLVLAAKDRLFLAPNGHGGTLAALAESGALDHMRDRGIDQLSYFQVDNPLVRPADTLFLGLHDGAGAAMSSKVVAKRDAAEKVGVIGVADGRLGCIEYSDLPEDLREARDGAGELVFRAGNIAVHALTRAFVEELNSGGRLRLPWHLARKQLDTVDASGAPARAPGVKFETFVFDALALADRSVTLEVDRAEEFSPVKNAEGEDSPATCRRDLVRLFEGYLAGTDAPPPPRDEQGLARLEVDPRFAESAEEFRTRAPHAPDDVEGGHLYR